MMIPTKPKRDWSLFATQVIVFVATSTATAISFRHFRDGGEGMWLFLGIAFALASIIYAGLALVTAAVPRHLR